MIKGDIRKLRKQRFFHDALQTYGRDWIRLTKMKKNSLIKNLLLALKKKKLLTFYHFSRLLLHFPNFFTGLENCWANFETFFSRIQGSVRTLPPAIPRNFPSKKLRSYRTDMRDSQSEFCQDDVPLKRKCLCYNSCRRPVPLRSGKSLLKSISLVWVCKI